MEKFAIHDDGNQVIGATRYLPSVSIILPVEVRIAEQKEMEYKLKTIIGKVEKELLDAYPRDKAEPVINKLKGLADKIDYHTMKKSIALFVSALVEKVFYLDFPAEEKVVIDESFEVRDLIYNSKERIEYYLLVLGGKESMLYEGNPDGLQKLTLHVPSNIAAYTPDLPDRVSNFSDPDNMKEIIRDRYLKSIDDGLARYLNVKQLPVFVLATEKVAGHFRQHSRHGKEIAFYLHGNYELAPENVLFEAVQDAVRNERLKHQESVLHQLEIAAGKGLTVSGCTDALQYAGQKNCRLLIVERDFALPGAEALQNSGNLLTHKDPVDDLMEQVLLAGGDVEFTETGTLQEYGGLVLIRYY